MATATKPCQAKPKQLLPLLPRTKAKRKRSDRRARETFTESAAGPLMAEEWPLELSLATLGAQGSSSSAGEGTVERRRGRPAQSKRRPSAAELYAELRALLPNVDPSRRLSKEEIVDAAVAQVKVLEDTAAVLEAYHGVRAPRRPEVAVACAAVCFSARLPAPAPGALRRVLEAFARRGVEVLAATVARHGGAGAGVADAMVTVTAAAAPPEVLEMIRADIACID